MNEFNISIYSRRHSGNSVDSKETYFCSIHKSSQFINNTYK